MAAKRMKREIFNAASQKKNRKYKLTNRKYKLTRDEAIEETLHELKLQAGVTRPSSRTERYDDYLEAERYGSDGPGCSGHEDPICGDPTRSPHDAPLQSSRDSGSRKEDSRRDPFTRPPVRESESSPFDPFTERRRSRSPPPIVKDCLTERAVRSKSDKDDLPRSRDASYSREQVFRKPHAIPPRREYSPRRSPPCDFVPPRSKVSLLEVFPFLREYLSPGQKGNLQRKRLEGAAAAANAKIPLRNDPRIDFNDNHVFSTRLGNQLIQWAGFDSIRKNRAEQQLLFKDKTEACSNAVIAFKLFLTQTYRDYCFSKVKDMKHQQLQCPTINNELLSILKVTNPGQTQKCFFETIKPCDAGMRKMQTGILKSIMPLLMACNTYERRQKVGYDGPEDMSAAFEKNVSLCRQSLVLLGQTFALATSIRQENILESMGILGGAPKPTDHPNLTSTLLFGKEYMTQLQDWLIKTRNPISIAPEDEVKKENKDKKPADPKIVETIGKLAEHCINLFKGKKTEKQPEFWFLFDEKSPEYQYYRTKLLETQKVRQIVKDGRQQTAKPTAEEAAAESVKRIEFSRRVREFKTKLFKNVALAKRRRLRAATEPLQAPKVAKRAAPQETSRPSTEVDAKTKDTAEKLANFVVQMGPEVEQFSKENIESNPEFWFLNEKDSAAYKYYQGKVAEFRKTETKEKASDSKKDQQSEVEADSAEGDSAEAAMACEISPEAASQDEVAKKAPVRTLPRKRVAALKVGMLPAKRVCHVEHHKGSC
ncbi:SURP and G-patch domain-containing protein 2-like isoform X2 [Lissotriton helveticus]